MRTAESAADRGSRPRDGVVARLLPGLEVVLHDVTVGAGPWVAREVRGALGVIEGVAADAAPGAVSQQAFELGLACQPTPGIQPEALAGRGYSPRRRRPRARRLRSTLRPPAVRLRTRNPWRRARRVFEGW